jgi:hypothetical protein
VHAGSVADSLCLEQIVLSDGPLFQRMPVRLGPKPKPDFSWQNSKKVQVRSDTYSVHVQGALYKYITVLTDLDYRVR